MFALTPTWVTMFNVAIAALGIVVAVILGRWVKKQPSVNTRIEEVGELIRKGSFTFLKKEYRVLAIFVGVFSVLLLLFSPGAIWRGVWTVNVSVMVAYWFGNLFSGFAGYIGIFVSTIANRKTAEAAQRGIKPAFLVSFRGGAVMGLAVVASALLGVSLIYLISGSAFVLFGFSFGASSMAMFAKAGGGIFTKTADIAADLTGKVELGIPEDDPRNPAVIADNVGDNVGDVAGMGADLFDSNVAAIVAALALGGLLDVGGRYVAMVLIYTAIGLLASIVGILFARMSGKQSPTAALNKSNYLTAGVYVLLTAAATFIFGFEWRLWLGPIGGLAAGILTGIATDYFTNDEKKPVRNTAAASEIGPAGTILSGFASGLMSVFPPMLGIGVAAFFAYSVAAPLGEGYGFFGIAIAAVGMLSINAVIIANDAYGPIADNARGLAEMGGLGDKVIRVLDKLDSAGNTVKAITKGFAIGSAGLAVLALLVAFLSEVNEKAAALGLPPITGLDLTSPRVILGMMIGAAVPAVFSAMLINGVQRNASRLVVEIRRQFSKIPGLKEGLPGVKPDYDACIELATGGALKELVTAGAVAIVITLGVGFTGGVEAIGGYLAGSIISGLILALLMSNAGGLWDNAKKYVEAGNFGGKGSEVHKAAVVGDTVGDPFKDTAGPAINTLLAAINLVSLLASGLFLQFSLF